MAPDEPNDGSNSLFYEEGSEVRLDVDSAAAGVLDGGAEIAPIPVFPLVTVEAPVGHQQWDTPPMPVVVQASNGQVLGLFFGHEFFCSNFHPARFRLAGHEWRCVEHFYVHEKLLHFGRVDYAHSVRSDPGMTPNRMKGIGRGVEQDSDPLSRFDWTCRKAPVMLEAVRAKFMQNCHLGDALIATGNLELVEASASDKFWGSGLALQQREQHAHVYRWRLAGGMNMLGLILNAVRDELNEMKLARPNVTWRAPLAPADWNQPGSTSNTGGGGSAEEGEITDLIIRADATKTDNNGNADNDELSKTVDGFGRDEPKTMSMAERFRRICPIPDSPDTSPSKKRVKSEGESWRN